MTTQTAPQVPGTVSRRKFLKATASGLGGLVLGFAFADDITAGLLRTAAAAAPPQMNAYLRIGPDNIITVLFGGCEFGQGPMSGVAHVVAEELMVDWSQVNVAQADAAIDAATGRGISYPTFVGPDGKPVNILYLTGGSGAFRNGNRFATLRMAGATAREMLITAGATALGVDRSLCRAEHGRVVTNTGQSKTYGELAEAASHLPVPAVTLTDPKTATWNLLGKRLPRVDIPQKTDGSAVYGLDVRLPGMLYAVVKHAPSFGATLKSTPAVPAGARYVLPLKAELSRGAVVKDSVNAVAVVADNTWAALNAARGLRATWDIPAAAADIDTAAMFAQAATLMQTGPALNGERIGDADAAMQSPIVAVDSTYSLPYVPHVCMEVLNCTVRYTGTSCEIWAPTQSAASVAQTAKALTGLTGDRIIVHVTFLGGGLGRKIEQDYPGQAIQAAMALKGAGGSGVVKLMWPREEDFTNDQYRPMALVRVQMALKAGHLALKYRTVTPSIGAQRGRTLTAADSTAVEGAVDTYYGFTDRLVEHVVHPSGVPVGYWRSVGHSINNFVMECAIDEFAAKVAVDPLQFRSMLLGWSSNPKAVRALKVIAEAARISPWRTALPAGHAWGMAVSESFGSFVCQIVDVSQPIAGSLRVHRVACAVDPGTAINPGSIEAQMQGGIVHGLSAALWGQQTWTKGIASARNFNAYRTLRASEMPEVSVTIVNSGEAIGGVGEPGVPPIAPAVANALFRLTGNRVRSLPFFPNAGGIPDN